MQAGSAEPAPRKVWTAARSIGFFVASFVASYVGVLTFYEPAQISLIWPLSGVAAVWLVTSTPRQAIPDLVLLGLAAALSVRLVIGGWDLALTGAALAVAPTLAMLGVLRRCGHWPRSTTAPPVLANLQHLVPYGGALLAGGLVTGLLRSTGLGIIEPSGLANATLTAVRFIAWTFAIGALVAIWADASKHSTARSTPRDTRTLRVLEWMVVSLATSWAGWLIFLSEERLPVIYPLFLVVVWASLRTSLQAAVTLSAGLGLTAVLFTLAGIGPFAAVSDPRTGAVLAQGFLVCMMLVSLVLSLSLRDRQSAIVESERIADIARDRAALLTAVLSNIEEGIVVVQDDDRIVLGNASSRQLLPHLVGAGTFTTPPPSSTHTLTFADGSRVEPNLLPNRRAFEGTYDGAADLGVRRDGKLMRTLEIKAAPLPTTSADQHARAVLTLRDVTAEREERTELEGFAGVVAHDLANPLTIIVGWSEALLQLADDPEPVENDELKTLALRLLGASSQMRAFINDLLGYTLSRNNVLQTSTIDLSELVHEIVASRDDANTVRVQPGIRVLGDAALLRQLLDNLIANAVKYVLPGSQPLVEVTASHNDERVTVAVQDNGIGIAEGERDRVFEDFFRASAVQSSYRGTGLGLAICRRVVNRHGGEIWVDHSVTAPHDGHGTRVCFDLLKAPG